MNDTLKAFAQQTLKDGLARCTEGEQVVFKLMYGEPSNPGLRNPGIIARIKAADIEAVVDNMADKRLDWAMSRLRRPSQRLPRSPRRRPRKGCTNPKESEDQMAEDQKTLDGFVPNAKRYREASEPHKSKTAANEALAVFIEELNELRVKHRIKDLLLVYGVSVLDADGNESVAMGTAGFGNQTFWESMAAFAFGHEQTKREQRIRELLSTQTKGV